MHNYRVLEQIGTGSYSTVFKAEDIRSGETVALKVMKFFYSHAKKTQDAELGALTSFNNHPCIVKLKQYFTEKDVLTYAIQLAGPNLLDYYKQFKETQHRLFNTTEIALIVFQVALALSDMHSEGWLHRDMKPENILLEPSTYAVKIVDFGLSKRSLQPTSTPYVATRWYRAPEIILNLPYDSKVDIFALGAIILQMYLGYESFPGSDAIDQLNKIFSVTGTPTLQSWPEGMTLLQQKRIQFPVYPKIDLKKYIPSLCDDGLDLIERMIQCNPKHRISSRQMLQHPYFQQIIEFLPSQVKTYFLKTYPTLNLLSPAKQACCGGILSVEQKQQKGPISSSTTTNQQSPVSKPNSQNQKTAIKKKLEVTTNRVPKDRKYTYDDLAYQKSDLSLTKKQQVISLGLY